MILRIYAKFKFSRIRGVLYEINLYRGIVINISINHNHSLPRNCEVLIKLIITAVMGYEIYIFISNNPCIPHDLIQKLATDITEMFYTVIQAIIDIELEVTGIIDMFSKC